MVDAANDQGDEKTIFADGAKPAKKAGVIGFMQAQFPEPKSISSALAPAQDDVASATTPTAAQPVEPYVYPYAPDATIAAIDVQKPIAAPKFELPPSTFDAEAELLRQKKQRAVNDELNAQSAARSRAINAEFNDQNEASISGSIAAAKKGAPAPTPTAPAPIPAQQMPTSGPLARIAARRRY